MSADYQSQTDKPSDKGGEVRPLPDKDGKLEDKIADEKDDELARLGRSDNDT